MQEIDYFAWETHCIFVSVLSYELRKINSISEPVPDVNKRPLDF